MAKVFNCKDFGGNCNWKGRAETVDALLKKIAKHGTLKHNMKGLTESMRTKILSVIREQ